MRYSVISKGLTPDRLEAEIKKVGGRDISRTILLGQIFCELDEDQAKALSKVSGLAVKPMQEYKTNQVVTALPPVETISDVFYLLRSYFALPLTGTGLTVAVLDSGIRKTHQSLLNKVIYEANYSGSPTADDIFGHGTQVAFIIAGGMHALGEKAGVSPGASLMNIKVIDDTGIGSDEGIIMGIDKVCHLAEEARRKGLVPTDEMYPNIINLSLGGEDDGDPDNPVRVACRQASQVYGLDVVAAAGNFEDRGGRDRVDWREFRSLAGVEIDAVSTRGAQVRRPHLAFPQRGRPERSRRADAQAGGQREPEAYDLFTRRPASHSCAWRT